MLFVYKNQSIFSCMQVYIIAADFFFRELGKGTTIPNLPSMVTIVNDFREVC